MSKFIVRCTVLLVAAYLLVCYLAAIVFGADIWSQWYYLLFELCLCLCISKQGVYHCRFIKWTAYAIFVEEVLAYLDVLFDFLPVGAAAFIQPTIIIAGITTTTVMAIRHFIKVQRIKKIWQSRL